MSISQDVINDIKAGILELTPSTFTVYWHLVYLIDHNKWAEITLEDVSNKTRIGVHTVMKCLNELIDLKLIGKRKISHKKVEYRVIR